jgi:hypothetical protein
MKDLPEPHFYTEVIRDLLVFGAVKATKYINPKLIVRATRKLCHGRFDRGNIEIILTFGRPNYIEREFIKLCQKAKEPFPIKKVQLKLYKPKPNKLKRKS